MEIHEAQTLAELATAIPAAAPVFRRHRLDYCCHGRRSLADACAERQLDAHSVVAEIARAESLKEAGGEVRWDEAPLAAVVDHVLTRYHAPLRGDLEYLVAAAAKVERVHDEKATCPHGLADHLAGMRDAIEEHLAKEERILFPMILAGRGAAAGMPIQVMLREHEDHGANLARLRALAHDFEPPADACTTWRALYLGLQRLEADLFDHIHLENNVLFPRALVS